ncbi:MAG: hypothetical protein ICV70_02780 [Jiangellaceae bacterium]|nr:hypothetical protein [Jiangellaceae bacterium]
MNVPELDEIVSDLYVLPPDDFVAARNELVRHARAAGHRDVAERLHRLRRPTRSAWLVNVLARHESAAMKRLAAVGRELRAAQTGLDGERLRDLAEQRRQVISDLLNRARHQAAEAGVQLTDSVLAEVEATLRVALVDLAGAMTVRNGRLVRPLAHDGFGPRPQVDAAPAAQLAPSEPPVTEIEPGWRIQPVVDELAARRQRTAADRAGRDRPPPPDGVVVELVGPASHQARPDDPAAADDPAAEALRELRVAEEELAAAEFAHWQREYELADAAAGLEAATDRLETLDSQRMEARRDKVTAERHLAEAQAAQREAVTAVAEARRRLDDARGRAGVEES